MIDYRKIISRQKKMRDMILDDYKIVNHLFKKDITFLDHVIDLKNKYSDHEDAFISDHEDEYSSSEYYSFINMLDTFLVIDYISKVNRKSVIEHKYNLGDTNYTLEIKKHYSSIYIIIDRLYTVCINANDLLCNVSLNDNKFYYSYLDFTIQEYLKFDSIILKNLFVDMIKIAMKK